MMRLGFVLVLCVYGALAYRIDYELEDMDRLWTRANREDCIKDIWILWDNSKSLGWKYFNEALRPFVKALIKNEKLNVGPDGTHIGIIKFGHKNVTGIWLGLGGNQTTLLNFLDKYDKNMYNAELAGESTRTGIAFDIVEKNFTEDNPKNYRADIDDVVIVITDGRPRRRSDDNDFGKEFSDGDDGEIRLAKNRTDKLRERGITVIGLVTGRQDQMDGFKDLMQSWVTKPVEDHYVNVTQDSFKDEMQSITDQIISPTCTGTGKCMCSEAAEAAPVYTAPGEMALTKWLKPTLVQCDPGVDLTKVSKVVKPNVSPPWRFGVGHHNVTYIFGYQSGFGVKKWICPVIIKVESCVCPPTKHITDELKPGQSEAQVSWTIPKPNCTATLKSVSRPGAEDGTDSFPVGEYTVTYNYKHTSRFLDSFTLSCPVSITVEGTLCRGVAFDPSTQECCCGTIADRQAHHECCGPDYYDTRYQTCKDFDTLVNNYSSLA